MVKARRGYTLTEVLMVVAILGILASMGPQLFTQVHRFIRLNQTRIELQREARAVFELINRNLRQSSVASIVITRENTNQPYCSKISFTDVDGVTMSFHQEGTNLYMSSSKIGTKLMSPNVRYLAFTPPRSEDLSIISVSMTLERNIGEMRTKALHMASEKVMVMNQ